MKLLGSRFVFRFPGVTGTFSGRLGIWKLLGHFPGEMLVACWKGERARLETPDPRPEFRSRIPVEIVPFSGRSNFLFQRIPSERRPL